MKFTDNSFSNYSGHLSLCIKLQQIFIIFNKSTDFHKTGVSYVFVIFHLLHVYSQTLYSTSITYRFSLHFLTKWEIHIKVLHWWTTEIFSKIPDNQQLMFEQSRAKLSSIGWPKNFSVNLWNPKMGWKLPVLICTFRFYYS